MRPLKFEWLEGPHGVDRLKIIGEHGILDFTPNPPHGADTLEHPFNRTATLHVVKALAEEVLQRLATSQHLHQVSRADVWNVNVMPA